ncbi:hypothetical protein [Stenotrophomonas rhizophila]|uniref:DUF5666 domain-containing protein n=1 Tax=Stenotrophomonas rhizophila TaxID=216778 RepID=A0AAW5PIA6_9GAMM|nr:hypothetical protein [Stenotrophomonas rhizophila]MCS4280106.1 hypothetical protein [Stenotrophomonas rhizophila]
MRVLALSSSVMLIAAALASSGYPSTASAAVAVAPPATRSAPGPVTAASSQVTLEGQITALDARSRAVTITGADGAILEFVAGPDVRNFRQLKVGDKVILDYTAAVALDLQPAGSETVGLTTAQAGTVPIRGTAPGGAQSNTVSIVTEVAAVDPVANTIALRGPRGNTQIIAVERDDLRAKLPNVKRGDLLQISYTEAVAVSIQPGSP